MGVGYYAGLLLVGLGLEHFVISSLLILLGYLFWLRRWWLLFTCLLVAV